MTTSAPSLLKICGFHAHRFHVDLCYELDGVPFCTKVFYDTVDLEGITERFGEVFCRQLLGHMALFESVKFCAPFPRALDVTAISGDIFAASIELFRTVYQRACAQHRYENQRPDYQGPDIVNREGSFAQPQAMALGKEADGIVVGSGGGKDSLVTMKLLEEAGFSFAAYQWARSEYGLFSEQHRLIDGLYQHVRPSAVHRLTVYDDFTDGVFMERYYPNVVPIFTLGTTECIFHALPYALHHGYRHFVVGNEKSAERGNLFWDAIGEEVNHQWVKSLEAEQLFTEFVQQTLLRDFSYFSLLKPVHDHRIFKKLSRYPQALPDMHSCNVEKPWCKKCPKCAYVWLNYLVHFKSESVQNIFSDNLFDDPELLPYFRQMMGLDKHNAFECVGEIDEIRWALKRCHDMGFSGAALDLFGSEILENMDIRWDDLGAIYDRVDHEAHRIPPEIFTRVQPLY